MTRVIPGVCAEGWDWEIKAIDCEGDEEIWKVLGPGEVDPTDEEWNVEFTHRASRETSRRSGGTPQP